MREEKMPTRREWLLRFVAGTTGQDDWIDRIRIMKGMFLFQQSAGAPAAIDYKFRPYDYGPFTAEIYRDLEELSDSALVAQTRDAQAYRVTEAGRACVSSLEFGAQPLASLLGIRDEVAELTFRQLLRRVYTAYPESAERSVAKDVLG